MKSQREKEGKKYLRDSSNDQCDENDSQTPYVVHGRRLRLWVLEEAGSTFWSEVKQRKGRDESQRHEGERRRVERRRRTG